jgi:methyl-accepting chemotaxis protein
MLGSTRVRQKLALLIALAVATLAAVAAYATLSERSTMMEGRRQEAQAVIQLGYGLLEHYGKLAQSGAMEPKQAQEAAKAAIGALRYDGANYLFLLDLKYNMVKNPVKPETEGKSMGDVRDANGTRMIVELVEAARRGRGEFVEYLWPKTAGEEPVGKISTAKLYEPWGWVVGSGLYVDDVARAFRAKALLFSAVGMLALILLLGASIFVANGITRPLESLRATMSHIESSGDLSLRANITAGGEIGEIGRSFNQMMDHFQTVIREVHVAVESLSAATVRLVESASTIESGSGAQSESASSAAAAIEEISASIDQIADNVSQAAALSGDLRQFSGSGRQVVQEAANEMKRIAEAVDCSARSVQELGSRSQRISEIVKVIRDIADQTNLLALNAAIEAARAGAQGRGFAVVADEVRKLAERTSQSTAEISAMIAAIQEETRAAVSGILEVSSQANKGQELAISADGKVGHIDAKIEEVSRVIADIACATKEQSTASQEIAKSIERISRMAEANTGEVGQTAGMVRDLEGLARHLKEKVVQFRG